MPIRLLITALALAVVLGAPAAARAYSQEQLQAAVAEVKAEPKVIDATWNDLDPGSILYVGMKDDGSRRDGFAEYVCMILSGHGIKGATVFIMDYGKFINDERVKLGQSQCPK